MESIVNPIHVLNPQIPKQFFKGESYQTLPIAYLKQDIVTHPITEIYFRTEDGIYRIERGNNLFIFAPSIQRCPLSDIEAEAELTLGQQFTYGENVVTKPLIEIVGVRRGKSYPKTDLEEGSVQFTP